MKQALQVIKRNYDTLENNPNAAISETLIGVFVDDETGTAYKKVGDWFSRNNPFKLYMANEQVWPQYKINRIAVH